MPSTIGFTKWPEKNMLKRFKVDYIWKKRKDTFCYSKEITQNIAVILLVDSSCFMKNLETSCNLISSILKSQKMSSWPFKLTMSQWSSSLMNFEHITSTPWILLQNLNILKNLKMKPTGIVIINSQFQLLLQVRSASSSNTSSRTSVFNTMIISDRTLKLSSSGSTSLTNMLSFTKKNNTTENLEICLRVEEQAISRLCSLWGLLYSHYLLSFIFCAAFVNAFVVVLARKRYLWEKLKKNEMGKTNL